MSDRDLAVFVTDQAAEMVGRAEVAAAWEEPSALEGMTVGALCAHLTRAAGATVAYLDRTDPEARAEDELLTDRTYFHAALDSPIHERIREVSADESAQGHPAIADLLARVATELRERLASEPPNRLVGALGGRMLTLDDFCRTRLIEVVLHTDDVAASVGVDPPEPPPEAMEIISDILVGIARHVHGDRAVVNALARRERAPAGVFPVI